MKIGLVGWGLETQSAYSYFGEDHDYVIGCEEMRSDFPNNNRVKVYALKDTRPPGLVGNVTDLSYLNHFDGCDLIIYQPSSRKNLEKRFLENDDFWKKAKTIQHIFFEQTPTKNIIGVTGTKGKGTTTTLTAKMIEACGKTVFVGGNIGVPVLDLLPDIKKDDWVVLELSSFQLYKFPYSPRIAVHLMMVPEHIDEWHITFEDYLEAKSNIFSNQSSEDIAIYLYNNDNSLKNVEKSKAKKIPFMSQPGAFIDADGFITIDNQQIIHKDNVGLLGSHNLENICAALTAAWQVCTDKNILADVIRDFKGLEHRLEFVAEIKKVKYYDDSFGTTPNTAIVAFDAIDTPKIVIVGGHDKGTPFNDLAERLTKPDIKHVILIGSTAPKIYDLAINYGLDKSKITIRDDGNSWKMSEIVNAAKKIASAGDSVVLSTGCSSFGLFQDYKDRGNQFKDAVRALS